MDMLCLFYDWLLLGQDFFFSFYFFMSIFSFGSIMSSVLKINGRLSLNVLRVQIN